MTDEERKTQEEIIAFCERRIKESPTNASHYQQIIDQLTKP